MLGSGFKRGGDHDGRGRLLSAEGMFAEILCFEVLQSDLADTAQGFCLIISVIIYTPTDTLSNLMYTGFIGRFESQVGTRGPE